MTRDESQAKFIGLWIKNNYMGGCAAVTSWGKTRTSIKCALECKSPDVNVIVPTKELHKQWNKALKEWKVPKYTVYVVNTAAKLSLNCDMLIIDEAHTAGMADWFQLSWTNAKFNKLLWLSATPERRDDKHKKLFSIAPKLMSVTFEEALENGWISNYDMYNVGVILNPSEKIIYNSIVEELKEVYNEIWRLVNYKKPKKLPKEYVQTNAFKLANQFLKTGVWEYVKLGKEYYELIGSRKSLLYNAENKLLRIVNYINRNPDKKVLVFSQSQQFADKLQEKLGNICVTIHSGLKDKEREYNLKRFRDGRTKIRIISSIKALNEGIDIPELDVGICASGTSSKKDMVQMLGRILRLHKDKHAFFFNLYVKGTQDLIWLKNRQWGLDQNKIKWI